MPTSCRTTRWAPAHVPCSYPSGQRLLLKKPSALRSRHLCRLQPACAGQLSTWAARSQQGKCSMQVPPAEARVCAPPHQAAAARLPPAHHPVPCGHRRRGRVPQPGAVCCTLLLACGAVYPCCFHNHFNVGRHLPTSLPLLLLICR